MDEYDPYESLLQKLMNAKSLSDIGIDQKKILTCFQKIIKELLRYKDLAMALRLQLQQINKSENLQIDLNTNQDLFSSEANFVTFSSDSNQSYQKQIQQLNDQMKSLEQKNSYLSKKNQNLQALIKSHKSKIKKLNACLLNKTWKRNQVISTFQYELKGEQKKDQKIQHTPNFGFASQKIGERCKVQKLFNHIILEKFSQINKSISNLYYILTREKDNRMRSLVLSVIFTLRWKNIKNKDIQIDQSSLMVYASNQNLSFDSRIHTIHQIIKSLTHELAEAKGNLIQNIQSNQKVVQNFQKIESALNFKKDNEQDYLNRIKFYKSKIYDLNEEISSMITKEKFDEVLKNYSSIDLENERLKASIIKLEQIIDEKNNQLKEFQKVCQNAKIQHSNDIIQKEEDQKLIALQKNSINDLNIRLKNRTKDLLSYERMASSLNKMLFNKQIDLNNNFPFNDDEPVFSKENINPKFLSDVND